MAVDLVSTRRPRLVLMTADAVGGVWSYAVDLAAALGARDVRVVLATMGARLSDGQRAQVEALGATVVLEESAYRLEWMDDPWRDVESAGRWLLALEREYSPDIVHLNQFAFGALPFRAPTLLVAHSCVLSWWRAVHGEPAPASWQRYRDIVARGLRGATLVGAPTRAMLGTLRESYGYMEPGVVLRNGRDSRGLTPGVKCPVIVSAGRLWDAAKNLAALDAVAPTLPWPVRVAGSVEHPDGGRCAATGVRLLGQLPWRELAGELASASIFALPARYEPFGLAALEAALAGCALVLGDIPSLREVWGSTATYVPPDDHEAIGGALRALITDGPRRRRMAAAARDRALTFTPDGMAAACLAAYARVRASAPAAVAASDHPHTEAVSCA